MPAIAEACARDGAWLHVDAAYAGAAMVCPEFRWAFAGVERADSLVVNAHKWMLTPMDCSLLWTRAAGATSARAFSLMPEYLRTPDAEDALVLSEYGPALGRRFRALKLWAVLRCYGRARTAGSTSARRRAGARVRAVGRRRPGWELCVAARASRSSASVSGAPTSDNQALLERVNATGEIFISHAVLDGRYVLRLAVGHRCERPEADVAARMGAAAARLRRCSGS